MTPQQDALFMRRAIKAARARLGKTGTNPAVGCVIVKDGVVVGEAATAEGGRPHAEEQALGQAGRRARGATVYITLEPCGMRTSGAASCSELLVAAKVARVVSAGGDSSPYASDRGLARLRDAGVTVETGLLAAQAAPLYVDYAARLAAAKRD